MPENGQLTRKEYTLRFLRHVVREQPIGVVITIVFVLAGILGPLLAPYPPNRLDMSIRLQGPSTNHWLGTDEYGRDMLSRILEGTRVALYVTAVALIFMAAFGVPLGIVSGYYGGMVDSTISRVLDAMFAFPAILLAIIISVVLGTSLTSAVIAIGVTGIPRIARVTRASVLEAKVAEYVEAARVSGATKLRIMARHILPNCIAPMIVQLSLAAPGAIMWESALSFLGLGVQPPTASWGCMLSAAKEYLSVAPTYTIFVGLALTLSIVGLNLFGDALRVVLDPRQRKLFTFRGTRRRPIRALRWMRGRLRQGRRG